MDWLTNNVQNDLEIDQMLLNQAMKNRTENSEKKCFYVYVMKKDADQPLSLCSLVSTFATLCLNSTVKFLNFRTPTNFTVNTLKFKLRGSIMVQKE